ncbi:MAG TPA: hypothetical protein VGC15_20365 [Acetobacteraceae bacterium]
MTRIVTAADLDGQKMDGGTMFLTHRDFHERRSTCKAFPGLEKIDRAPRNSRSKVAHSVGFYVAGVLVPENSLDAIAAALTAHYASTPPPPFDFEAEMQEANEP